MPRGALFRLVVVPCTMLFLFVYIWRSHIDASRSTLFVTMVIAFLTSVYAVLTFEIVLQNQTMSQAASDSAKSAAESARVMERSLRFSHTPNLTLVTLITKDLLLNSENNVVPYKAETI